MSTDLDHPSSQITPARRAGDRTLPHIPTEIYEAIFTHLEDPSFGLAQPDDIRDTYVSLIFVCRLFYTLGIPHRFRHINRINNAHDDLPYEKHESFIRAITAHPSPVSHILKLVKSVKFWGWLEEEYDEMREKYPSEYDYSALFHRQVACLGAINNLTRIDISDCRISYLLIQQIASLSTLEDVSFNSCHEWEDFPEYPAPVSMPPTPWKSFLLMESENNDYSADRQYGALFADLALSPELLSLSASVPEFFPELTPERLARLVGLKSLLIDLYSSGLRKLVEIPGQALETLTIQDPGRMYEKSPSSEDKDMIQHLSSCFPKLKSLPECPAYLVNALLPKRPVTLLHAKHFCGDPAIFATSTAGLTSLFISIEALKKGALPPLPCLVDFALHFESLRSPQYVRDCFQRGSPITRPVHPTVPVIRFEYSSDGKSPQHNLPLQHAYIVEAVQDAFPGAIKFSVWYDPGITFSEQFDYHAACVWQRRDGANEWAPRPPRDLKSLRIYLRSMSASSYRLWNGGGHGRSVFRSHVEAVDVFMDWNRYFESVFKDERAREDERAHEDELDREDVQDREATQEHDEEDKGENERDHGDDEVGEDYDDEDDESEQNYDDEDEGDPEIVMPEALRYLLERGAQHPVAFDDSVDGSNEHD